MLGKFLINLFAKPVVMCRRFFFLMIFFAFPFVAIAQEIKPLQELFIEAEYFFMNEDYSDALPFYLQIYEKVPGNANVAYRIGACYLNINGKKIFP